MESAVTCSISRKQQEESARKRAAEIEARAEDPGVCKRYRALYDALEGGRASVRGAVPGGVDPQVGIHEKRDGWRAFLHDVAEATFTCVPCGACGHVLVRRYDSGIDGDIVRGDGTAGADNWVARLDCAKCGRASRAAISLSYDTSAATGKVGDPIARAFGHGKPWWRFW